MDQEQPLDRSDVRSERSYIGYIWVDGTPLRVRAEANTEAEAKLSVASAYGEGHTVALWVEGIPPPKMKMWEGFFERDSAHIPVQVEARTEAEAMSAIVADHGPCNVVSVREQDPEQRPKRDYVGYVWIGDEPGIRVSVQARHLFEARERVAAEYPMEQFAHLWNEDDSQRPR